MDWGKSLYREEWKELLELHKYEDMDIKVTSLDDVMEWMVKAVNRRKQDCNCENNSKPYCITKEY